MNIINRNILSFDQSTTSLGWSLLMGWQYSHNEDGESMVKPIISYGTVIPKGSLDLNERLCYIWRGVSCVINDVYSTYDIDDIDENITFLKLSKQANEIILHHMENNLPYSDSLDFYFANLYPFITFSPNQTTFNNLKQTGMNLITNDSLRANISDLYANRFNIYKVFEKTYFVEHYINYIKPMFMTEFKTFKLYESFKPNNYNQFIKNKEYKQIMNYTVGNCKRFIIYQSTFKKNITDLILQIDNKIAE